MTALRYLSVCSGIEAATQAWAPLGWKAVAFSEIEPFPCAVLAHHYPNVPNWGDMTKFEEWPDAAVDLICGGTPCQDYSVAGLRAGLAGDRGQLTLQFVKIAARYRPRWIVWENVPGVLSSNNGRDFAAFLCDLGACGYGWAYRILDAQYVRTRRFPFAVPQRRRRVWLVGYLGDWRRAAAVLFDRESLSGHPAPRRETRKVAPAIPGRILGGGSIGTDCDGGLICANSGNISYCLTASAQNSLDAETETETLLAVANTLRAEGFDASEDGTGRQNLVPVAFDCKGTEVQFTTDGSNPTLRSIGHADSHQNSGGHAAIATHCAVRRLTPRECERLMGFPDDFTCIPWRGKPPEACPDGPRYKALGNSWAVNCAEWIGERIAIVDQWGDHALEEIRRAA